MVEEAVTMMERCYEYLGCNQTDCVMYGRDDDVKCWEMEGTLCNHPGFELIAKTNKDKCTYCIYYKAVKLNMSKKGAA